MIERGKAAGALALALAAACALAAASWDRSDSLRLVLPAMEAEDAAALCAQSGVKLADFWARARAMGVAAAVVRPQSLDQAVARGEILKFSRAEIERWKAAGLLAPSATLRPDAFWVKDPRVLEQVLQAVSRQGIKATTSAVAGYHLVHVPEEAEDLSLRGYDPERVAAADGLAVVYAGPGTYLARAGLRWSGEGVSGESEPADGEAFGLTLDAAAWRVGSSRGALLRQAYGRPRRLLVLRLSPALGLEGSLARARAALRELAAEGVSLALPAGPPAPPPLQGVPAALARAAAWLLGVLAPLFAARGGLLALRRARAAALERCPVLSPVVQLAAGLAATAALAALPGLVIHALAGALGAPLGRAWAVSVLVGPLAIAALTLYTIDLERWGKALRRPATYAALLKILALFCVVGMLLAPRWWLRHCGLWPLLRGLGGWLPAAWWWPWRWREMLAGYPLLLQAMFLINWRLDCPECASLRQSPADDPRVWFIFGLLAPIGIVTAVGSGAVAESLALGQTAAAWLIGCGAGALGVAVRLRALRSKPAHAGGSKDLHH